MQGVSVSHAWKSIISTVGAIVWSLCLKVGEYVNTFRSSKTEPPSNVSVENATLVNNDDEPRTLLTKKSELGSDYFKTIEDKISSKASALGSELYNIMITKVNQEILSDLELEDSSVNLVMREIYSLALASVIGELTAELWLKVGNKEAKDFMNITIRRAIMFADAKLPGDHRVDLT